MQEYLQEKDVVLNNLGTTKDGLSSEEAAKRLAQNGPNKLAEGKKTNLAVKFLQQLSDPMIIVLIAAAAVSGITSYLQGESFADVFIILFVVLLNSVLGVIQENKAEEAIDALKKMTKTMVKVIRDGKMITCSSEMLVKGDVVSLEAGDAVPADARIIEAASIQAEEAALTGESVPVNKQDGVLDAKDQIPLGDRKNMLYMGSSLAYGRGRAVVCATGMDTEMGKIANALTMAKDEATPLQQKLTALSKSLTWLVLIICVVIFGVGILRAGKFTTDVATSSFMLAVSLAVAAIPEGLAAVVTIVLSIGVTKMSRQKAVIRKLTAVETLGCAQIICSDKTGTLTQNKMTVVKALGDDQNILAKAMCLCSDAELDDTANNAVGEATECALVNYASKLGFNKNKLKLDLPRIGEAPFDSMRKMMSTVHKTDKGFVQFSKGAPDEILRHCSRILTKDGPVPMTEQHRENIRQSNKDMADNALRVLAGAFRNYSETPGDFSPDNLEQDMTFIGLYGMIDPIRPEVKTAVEKCKSAGIRVIMITGDHIDTAVAIAKELGLITDASQAIRGQDLNGVSDEQLQEDVVKYSVYARVQPEHKVRIVSAWKARAKVTAMTGDGVNDAPSIKSADIGIGMGITGTDVTKNVADMILADDNFATIVSAVEEGRRIYANIRKAIQYLLSSNLSEVLSVFFATMLGFVILKPVHILWINLITDSLPALALGMEAGEPDIMKQPPRDSKDGIFADGVGAGIGYLGFLVTLLTLAAYFIGHYLESGVWEITQSPDGITMAFLTMSMAEIFQSFNMRSQRRSLFQMPTSNWYLWGAAGIALLLTTLVIYVPFLRNAFSFEPISLFEYVTALALAFAIIPMVELVKIVHRKLK